MRGESWTPHCGAWHKDKRVDRSQNNRDKRKWHSHNNKILFCGSRGDVGSPSLEGFRIKLNKALNILV